MRVNTLIIGSGAAGLAAAVRLHSLGVTDLAIFTEGLRMGTSINTGSDKQTYYKLGMCGTEPDAPVLMAQDLAAGGAMHGDIALVEAAMSPIAFSNLTALGVRFPHDEFGQYVGYKTDHDPKRRATSCGPYTSRDMCLALIEEIKRRKIAVYEAQNAIELLTDAGKSRVIGALFINRVQGEITAVHAENIVFATGGPGGLYSASVYPKVQTGGIGIALAAGAAAYNLAEGQFGLASTKFRWNVSGSYMQVLPRFISTDANGGDEREFLREYFDSTAALYDAVFLKGYQWPFAAGHIPGSSMIDLFTYIETVERQRRVFLDYRRDPDDLGFDELGAETREYLTRSGAWAETPLQRLEKLNPPAIELYRGHQIDLASEPLEIAVCAQHNNGGLAGNIWWESVNLKHLFPVGEVNGTHGVTRPGGSALNSGQVGAFRAAEFIAANYQKKTDNEDEFKTAAAAALSSISEQRQRPAQLDWEQERTRFQKRMSECGAFIRSLPAVETALAEARQQLLSLQQDGLGGLAPGVLTAVLRNRQLLTAQICYLACIQKQAECIGSRGGAIVLGAIGHPIHAKLSDLWRVIPENPDYRGMMMHCVLERGGAPVISWEPCRPIPAVDGWFETIWSDYRSGKIFTSADSSHPHS